MSRGWVNLRRLLRAVGRASSSFRREAGLAGPRPLPGRSAGLLDVLEARIALDAVAWTGGAGDNLWHTPGNWSGGAVPTAADDVTIEVAAANPTITLNSLSGSRSVRSLAASENLDVQGGATLQVTTTSALSGGATMRLGGGTLSGGTWTFGPGSGIVPTSSGGALNSVTVNGEIVLSQINARVQITGTTTFTGLRLSADNTTVGFAPGYTLAVPLTLEGTGTGYRFVEMNGSPGTLTIASTGSMRRTGTFTGGAIIGVQSQFGGAMTLVNNGTISNDVAGTLVLQPSVITNNGTIQAVTGGLSVSTPNWRNAGTVNLGSGADLSLDSAFDATQGIGTFTTSAGTVFLRNTVNNAGNNLSLNAATGSWRLQGGTINGGALSSAGGASLVYTSSGGTLNNVTVNGEIVLSQVNARVQINGTTTFTGMRLSTDNTTVGFAPGFTLTVPLTLEGTGSGYRFVEMNGTPGTLTIGPTGSVRRSGTFTGGAILGVQSQFGGAMTLVNNGLISNETAGTLQITSQVLTNNGTIQAVTGTLSVNTPNWRNAGTVNLGSGAELSLDSVFDATQGIGTFTTSTGTVFLRNTVSNAGNNLSLNAATGSWRLQGGTINGGSLSSAGGASLLYTSSGGTLNNVTVNGEIVLSQINSRVQINGTTTFTGMRLSADNTTVGFAPGFTLTVPLTLEGTGTGYRFVEMNGAPGTLTIAPTGSMRRTGTFTGGAILGVQSQFGGAMTLVNNGVISNDTAGTLGLQAQSLSNTGTIQAETGTLSVAIQNWRNEGTVNLGAGAILSMDSDFNATQGIGTFTTSAGTVFLRNTVNNAGNNLSLNAATGSWRLQGGTINGGALSSAGGASLVYTSSGGTLNNVTVNGEIVLSQVNARVQINGTTTFTGMRLSTDNTTVGFAPGFTLTVPLTLEGTGSGYRFVEMNGTPGTLTIGPTGSVRRSGTFTGGAILGVQSQFGGAMTLVNNGLISNDTAGTLQATPQGLTNNGTVRASGGVLQIISANATSTGSVFATGQGRVEFPGDAVFDGDSLLVVEPAAQVSMRGDVLGGSTNRDLFGGLGRLVLDGNRPQANPQLIEVMSAEAGADAAAFTRNFAYGAVVLGANSYVRLVDFSDNSAGDEAMYVSSLTIPAGATLDLNGHTLYARAALIGGQVIGGAFEQVADSGPIETALATPGQIAVAGELDEWTFFANQGRLVTVVVNPGSTGLNPALQPLLRRAQVSLVDPSNNVIATAESAADGASVTLEGVPLPASGEYRILVRAASALPASTGNYTVMQLDVTPDVAGVNLNQLAFGEIESAYGIDVWEFAATSGQQLRFDLRGATSPELRFTLRGPNGDALFSDAAGDSALFNIVVDGAYSLTARGAAGATGQYSFVLSQTAITDLTVGTALQLPNPGTDGARLLRFTMPATSALILRLDDTSNLNRNELYLRQGAAPTRTQYDYRYNAAASADQSILVPSASGEWYALIFAQSSPNASVLNLEAVASGVVVQTVSPATAETGTIAAITMTGAGFGPDLQVTLVNETGALIATANEVDLNSFTSATAIVSLAGVPQGRYSVRVQRPGGGTDTLADAFEVLPVGVAQLETRLILPPSFGRHAVATLYVEYANTGTAPMAAPLLRLESADPDNSDRPILTLDQSRLVEGFWTSGLPEGFSHSIQILASGAAPGILAPGERVQLPVYYAGLLQPWDFSDGSVEMEIRVFEAGDTALIPWSEVRESTRPSSMDPDAWNVVFANLTTNVGPTWGDYVRVLSENAQYLDRLGLRVSDVGELWRFEAQQAIGFHPTDTLTTSVDLSVDAPGGGLGFGRLYATRLDQRFEQSIFGRGWSAPWQSSLTIESSGAINLFAAAGQRGRFEPDTRRLNTYISLDANPSTMTKVGTEYQLRSQSGEIDRYNENGVLIWSQDTNGNRVTMGYTGGRLTSLTHSAGAAIAIAYNAAGLVSSVSDNAGRTTTYAYDPSNQYLLSVTKWNGEVSTYTYNTEVGSAKQHALTSIGAYGTTRTFEYDSSGRLAATSTTGDAERVDFTYDSAGRVTMTDAAGGTTVLSFDHRGLVSRAVDPLGQVATAEYGIDLRISKLVDPYGHTKQYTWCSCGNLTSLTNELGATSRFAYTNVGPGGTVRRMTASTDALGNTTRYTYDAQGNLRSIIRPSGATEQFGAYDPSGSPLSYVNARGQTMGYAYNSAGQVTRQTFVDGTFNDYGYDARGNLVTITEPGTLVTTMQYDSGDRLTRVEYPNGRFLAFTYDGVGRRASMTDQSGYRVDYAYDASGRLWRLTENPGAVLIEYTYDDVGRLLREDNANGTNTVYTYDVAGRVLSIVNLAPGGAVNSRFDYTYDALGRRLSMTTLDGTWTYSHNAAGQLIGAVFAPAVGSPIAPQNLAYVYDAAGNRIRTIENGVTTNYTSNSQNLYTAVGQDTLVYDADGNLVSRSGPSGSATYTYDQRGLLTRVVTPTGVWQYEYDALGNRRASTFNGQRTEYVMDPTGMGEVAGEYASAGQLVARYLRGLGLAVRIDGQSGQRAFYDFDAMGNTSTITGPTGTVVNRYDYTPWGESLRSIEGINNPFEFAGQAGVQTDSHGLHFMRARYYSGGLGRFVALDPMELLGGDANLSMYAKNMPTELFDPVGKAPSAAGKFFGGSAANFGSGAGTNVAVGEDADVPGGITGTFTNVPGLPGAGNAAAFALDPKNAPDLVNGVNAIRQANDCGTSNFSTARQLQEMGMTPDGCRPFNPIPPSGGLLPEGGYSDGGGNSGAAAATDPNALYGPAGYGPQNFVAAGLELPYRIEFENYGPGSLNEDGTPVSSDRWATAPAQRVVVTNRLNASLDLSTFRYTGFGWGDFDIRLATPAQSWQQIVTMTYAGSTFEVWFEAEIDYASRELRMVFQSIDPGSSLPPEVLVGFLPPEDGTGRGKGFVTYTVAPVTGLPTGTPIRNIALIQFDGQVFIATNQVDPLNPSLGTDPEKEALVTIDAGIPTSSVASLPPVSNSRLIRVQWAGQDDAGGSGVGSYNISYSVDGGPIVPWLIGTTLTSADFTAENLRTYSFYSVAIDNTGQREPLGNSPDATTFVQDVSNTWDGDAGDGLWTTPANWQGDTLPNAGNTVIIPSGASVQLIGADVEVFDYIVRGGLAIEDAELSSTGESRVFGTLVLRSGGSLDVSGGLRIEGTGVLRTEGDSSVTLALNAALDSAGQVVVAGGVLTIAGSGSWNASGALTIVAGSISIAATATLSGTVTLGGSGLTSSSPSLAITGAVSGAGGLFISGGGTAITSPSVSVGVLTLNTATLTLGTLARVNVAGAYVQNAAATLVVLANQSTGLITAQSASLAGSLNMQWVDGFDPSLGAPLWESDYLFAGSFTGDFTSVQLAATRVGSMLNRRIDDRMRLLFNVFDYNGDGGVDSDDVIAYFADWDNSNPLADLNGDGGVDSDDLILWFQFWDLGGR
ncbi:MAG: RHS repeat-associated core domain-containing protein [Phycisphaerales bacterium]